jgi:hypothetical protein
MPARKIGLATDKQHGKVDMLKAARSTIAENVMRNKLPRGIRAREIFGNRVIKD